jgi:dipeptidyl aminopeptidase/acylaminoacyl peptidase
VLICGAVLLLTSAPAAASFPGRNGAIAFQDNNRGGVFTVEPDGSHLRRLTDEGYEPSWSPNGRRIVYSMTSRRDSEIAIMHADGSHRQVITDDRASQWDPAWSPNGKWIAYRQGAAREDDGTLFTMRADGTQRLRLGANGQYPDWSVPLPASGSTPAARRGRIAFTGLPTAPCSHGLVNFAIDPDGTHRAMLFTCDTAFQPSWSPDGSRLAFGAYAPLVRSADIFVGDPITGATSRVTDRDGYDVAPAWSPDGSEIVFEADDPGGGLELVDPAVPFAETEIPHTSGMHAARPDWGPR